MLSCRHGDCDSNELSLSCGNTACDSCDGIGECRHNGPETGPVTAESRRDGHAVTGRRSKLSEISSHDGGVTVRLPAELPTLTPRVARALLAILVELTEVPVLDRPGEGVSCDC
jgi:hypothetical protein